MAEQPSGDTRAALVRATIDILRENGHARASARAIAARAGCNQALIFYYFGSVADLFLAALDEVSAQRFERYSAAVDAVRSSEELIAAAGRIFQEDLEQGYVRVLVELIGAASSIPAFGAEVLKRIKPWEGFAQRTMARLFEGSPLQPVAGSDLGGRVVAALFLGLEMLAHLEDGETGPSGGVAPIAVLLPAVLTFLSSVSGPVAQEGSSDG
jgi:AcrR family transcriptional regulator